MSDVYILHSLRQRLMINVWHSPASSSSEVNL